MIPRNLRSGHPSPYPHNPSSLAKDALLRVIHTERSGFVLVS
jgi:hypothetical protein